MKQIAPLHRAALLLPTLLLLAAACTPGDAFDDAIPAAPTRPGAAITITVTDGGYAAADAPAAPDGTPATRAVEKGFATEFTPGDAIGIYVVNKEKKAILENGKFTYDGMAWQAEPNQELPSIPHDDEYLYFAYYPYQDDMSSGKPILSKDYAEGFFSVLINLWDIKNDQSTYAKYAANDLMVAQGVVAPRTDGAPGSTLSFRMEHQMGLLVIRLPRTTCTYTETISNEEKTKSYDLYTGAYVTDWWQENHYTARRIIRTDQHWGSTDQAFYYDSGFKKHDFPCDGENRVSGTYKLYTVDNATETKSDRPLREGDFYMKDGTVLPQEAFGGGTLPDNVKKDCIGVVFWVGEIAGTHWTQTGYKKGDHLLMRDHPECVHGMVVAMHDASPGAVFATGKGTTESTYAWADSFSGFTPGEQADWKEIRNSDSDHGYGISRLLTLYGIRHDDTSFPVLDAIAAYAAAHPVPASSSEWFLPGRYEFATLCFGGPRDYGEPGDPYYFQNLLMLKVINPRIRMASGDELNGGYWSSTEWDETTAWWIDVSTPRYGTEPKNKTYKVRAVLAF